MLAITNAIVIALLIVLFLRSSQELFKSRSSIDGRKYSVEELEGHAIAANKLASLNSDTETLIKHLEAKYPNDHRLTRNLKKRWREDAIHEHTPGFLNNTVAYTWNKGQKLGICLRDLKKPDKSFHHMNAIKFVYLHELAHVASDVKQHPPEFWRNFKWLLHEAEEAGVYDPTDYQVDSITFCNDTHIAYNPYYDTSITI